MNPNDTIEVVCVSYVEYRPPMDPVKEAVLRHLAENADTIRLRAKARLLLKREAKRQGTAAPIFSTPTDPRNPYNQHPHGGYC